MGVGLGNSPLNLCYNRRGMKIRRYGVEGSGHKWFLWDHLRKAKVSGQQFRTRGEAIKAGEKMNKGTKPIIL